MFLERSKMTKLTILDSKLIEEEIEEELEEIQLPLFDIVMHEDGTWVQRAIEELEKEECLKH